MKETDTHIYFWNGPFSNWHPAVITDLDNGKKYLNSQQAFMWYKAITFGDLDTAKKIEETPDPRTVKNLGREVKDYNDIQWARIRYDVMRKVNWWKFTQIQAYQEELMSTGEKILVEASPYDLIWGVGLSEDDPLILDEKNWKGQNLLGRVLMEIREMIR